MTIITNELRAVVDVDNTLIENVKPTTIFVPLGERVTNVEEPITADYYGTPISIKPKGRVVDFVKSLKARGYHITVHSNNGWQWAKNVVEALGLDSHVDMVCTKSSKCIDDETNIEHIMGTLIHPTVLGEE